MLSYETVATTLSLIQSVGLVTRLSVYIYAFNLSLIDYEWSKRWVYFLTVNGQSIPQHMAHPVESRFQSNTWSRSEVTANVKQELMQCFAHNLSLNCYFCNSVFIIARPLHSCLGSRHQGGTGRCECWSGASDSEEMEIWDHWKQFLVGPGPTGWDN